MGSGFPSGSMGRPALRDLCKMKPDTSIPHLHFLLFGLALVLSTPLAWAQFGAGPGILVGFDIAALVFIASAMLSMQGSGADMMREHAQLNDARPSWLIAITLAVLTIILFAVAIETNGRGGPVETKIAPLMTLVVAWFFSNVVFTLHYAHLYYRQRDGADAGGLSLPNSDAPSYLDFAYFSFVIGMTFQVSDIEITSRDMRMVCLVHSLT